MYPQGSRDNSYLHFLIFNLAAFYICIPSNVSSLHFRALLFGSRKLAGCRVFNWRNAILNANKNCFYRVFISKIESTRVHTT